MGDLVSPSEREACATIYPSDGQVCTNPQPPLPKTSSHVKPSSVALSLIIVWQARDSRHDVFRIGRSWSSSATVQIPSFGLSQTSTLKPFTRGSDHKECLGREDFREFREYLNPASKVGGLRYLLSRPARTDLRVRGLAFFIK
jgi:hypothetical protein